MNFKRRILEEDYGTGGFTSNIKEGAKNNWGKLLGAGAAGALGMGALLTHNDDAHDTLENLRDLDKDDNLVNTGIDKVKGFLDNFKSDSSGDTGPDSKGGFLDRITGGHSVDTTKLKAAALPYAHNNDAIFQGIRTNDVSTSDLTPADTTNYQAQAEAAKIRDMQEYQKALANASKDNMITPQEQAQLDALKEKVGSHDLGWGSRILSPFFGEDKLQAEKFAEQQLQNSMDWAKQNNMGFLLNGNYQDDIKFFNDVIQKYGKIPDELQPLYKDVLRRIQG